ncbi:MAG: hypothetical protein KF696_01405 [Planctomycetes bacterium]|nr:hypothetical protein [Planctomycetota bacterium]MCW8134403.1 hypothetical protein [Planctomycetota bacterium]
MNNKAGEDQPNRTSKQKQKISKQSQKAGAGEGARTNDHLLGKICNPGRQ